MGGFIHNLTELVDGQISEVSPYIIFLEIHDSSEIVFL